MKLLIVTQVVDREDPVLGFFHRWIEEFASQCELVTVVCLKEGAHNLPQNVRVISLGKEQGQRSRLEYSLCFLRIAYAERNEYDAVFVHMNPEYLIIAGWLWRLLGKKTILWYLHKTVSLRLRAGILFSDIVCTASPASMRAKTHKKRIVGHGIDEVFHVFVPQAPAGPLTLVTVSRIGPVKRIEALIEAFVKLETKDARFLIIGGAMKEHGWYLDSLKELAERLGVTERVSFAGPHNPEGVRDLLSRAHLFVHASATGSIDKAPLEALSMGLPVVTENEELARSGCPAIFAPKPEQSFVDALAGAVAKHPWKDAAIRQDARSYIEEHYRLTVLVRRLLAEFGSIGQATGMIADSKTVQEHFNRVAKDEEGSYEERRWQQNARAKAHYDFSMSFMERFALPFLGSGNPIVELGPGPGTWTQVLAKGNPSSRFILTDISSEMLERASASVSGAHEVETREGDFTSVAFNEGEAGTFFSSRALEYVADKSAALRSIFFMLKPNGAACIITKMPKRVTNALRGHKASSLHQGQIYPSDLKRLARDAGFKEVRLYPVAFSVPFLRSASVDRAMHTLFSRFPLNPLSALFTESYAILLRRS